MEGELIMIILESEFKSIKDCLLASEMMDGRLILKEKVDHDRLALVYKFFRKSFMDGYIPIKKPIGFYIINKKSYNSSEIYRNPAILESQIELIKNIAKITIVGNCATEVVAHDLIGKVKAGNLKLMSDGNPVKILDPSIEVMNCISNIDLGLIIHEDIGSRIMDENMEIILELTSEQGRRRNNIYPLNTESTLIENIRILPFNRFDIRYVLVGNISEKDMNALWKNYINKSITDGKGVIY